MHNAPFVASTEVLELRFRFCHFHQVFDKTSGIPEVLFFPIYIYNMNVQIYKKKTVLPMLLAGTILCACGDNGSSSANTPDNEFKNSMDALDWGDGTAYVIGHKIPDVDAVTSALAYADLMQALGYKAEARILGQANRETELIADRFGFKIPEILETVEPTTRLILTDHAEYAQTVDGAPEANILQIIDHHTPGDIDEAVSSNTYVKREIWGSTCTLVWDLYRQAEIDVDDSVAKILLAGILSDTQNLTKVSTTAMDSTVLDKLTSQLGISKDSVAAVYQEMDDASHDYYGMTDREIFLSDYKDYEIAGYKIGIASMEWFADSSKEDFIDRMLGVMPEIASEKERTMLFAKVDLYTPAEAGSFVLVYGTDKNDSLAGAIAAGTVGEEWRDRVYFSPEKLSRKTHMVPKITEFLENSK